jgi:hypothetical protein
MNLRPIILSLFVVLPGLGTSAMSAYYLFLNGQHWMLLITLHVK